MINIFQNTKNFFPIPLVNWIRKVILLQVNLNSNVVVIQSTAITWLLRILKFNNHCYFAQLCHLILSHSTSSETCKPANNTN